METRIDVSKLIEILTENKEKHEAIFKEAVDGYRRKATEELQNHIKRIERGKLERVYISLPEPTNHIKDYEAIIKMLELSEESSIVLTSTDVAQYVCDDWAWKGQFLTENSAYSPTAAASLGS